MFQRSTRCFKIHSRRKNQQGNIKWFCINDQRDPSGKRKWNTCHDSWDTRSILRSNYEGFPSRKRRFDRRRTTLSKTRTKLRKFVTITFRRWTFRSLIYFISHLSERSSIFWTKHRIPFEFHGKRRIVQCLQATRVNVQILSNALYMKISFPLSVVYINLYLLLVILSIRVFVSTSLWWGLQRIERTDILVVSQGIVSSTWTVKQKSWSFSEKLRKLPSRYRGNEEGWCLLDHPERRDCPNSGSPELWRCKLTKRCTEGNTSISSSADLRPKTPGC